MSVLGFLETSNSSSRRKGTFDEKHPEKISNTIKEEKLIVL